MVSAEESSHSPPRRKRKRARDAPTSDASTSPNLATIFHGLAPVPSKTSARVNSLAVSGDVDLTSPDLESETCVDMKAVVQLLEARLRRLQEGGIGEGSISSPLDTSRPPTAPMRPKAPITRLSDSRSRVPTRLAPSNDALFSSSPLLIHSSRQGTQGDSKQSIVSRTESVGSAYWAARVLSPLFRQEQEEKEKRLEGRRIIRQSAVLSADSSDDKDRHAQDSEEDRVSSHIVSVEDFLSNIGGAASGCTTRGMKKRYASKRATKIAKPSIRSESNEKKKRIKRRKKVLADYTSSDSDDYSNEKNSKRPTSSGLLHMLKTPHSIRKTPRKPLVPLRAFLGADSIMPGILPTTPYPTRSNSNRTHLEFSRASQLTKEELEIYSLKKQRLAEERRKVIARDWKGAKGDTFLASIEDTSFGGALLISEGAILKRRIPMMEGHTSITSRAFPVEKIVGLVTPFIDLSRRRGDIKIDRSTRTGFVPLELISEEQSDVVGLFLSAGLKKSRETLKAVKPKARLNIPPTPTSLPLHATINIPFQEDVLSMSRSFRRTLKRKVPISGPSTVISTIEEMEVNEDPPAAGIPDREESKAEPENLIALLPTPAVTRFRFITGAKAKRRPTLQFVSQEEAGSYASAAPQLNADNNDLSQAHPRLDMIPQSEYDMERAVFNAERIDDEEGQIGYAFEGEEWDSNPSFEETRMPITNSFLAVLDECDELPARSCSTLDTPEDSVVIPPLRRHVTFSSPSPAKSYYDRTIAREQSHPVSHFNMSTSLLAKKDSTKLTPSTRQLSVKKPLRKMSLVPDFKFLARMESNKDKVNDFDQQEISELSIQEPDLVSLDSPLPFPPANQLGCDELIYGSSLDFSQMEGVNSFDALIGENAGIFERELMDAALAFDNIEDSRTERGADVNFVPGPATNSQEEYDLDSNLPLFCDPHAILPLPSSLPAGISARPPRRTRTWGGSRLTELGFGEGV